MDEQNDFLGNLYYYLNLATKIILKSFNWIVVLLVGLFLFILALLSLIFKPNTDK
jgi:hypothetical protein